jgi:hypothetical protein
MSRALPVAPVLGDRRLVYHADEPQLRSLIDNQANRFLQSQRRRAAAADRGQNSLAHKNFLSIFWRRARQSMVKSRYLAPRGVRRI